MRPTKERIAEIREEVRMQGGGGIEGDLLNEIDALISERGACTCDDGPSMCHRCAINHVNAQTIQIENLKAEATKLLDELDQVLTVPAAEYVPAITDSWKIIAKIKNLLR